MQFNLDKFIGEEEFTTLLPKLYKRKYPEMKDPVFTLRLYTNQEAETARASFVGLADEDRHKTENVNEYVRKSICALLTKEPANIDDFPTGKEPLYERALKYFTDRPAHIQAFLDSMLGNAYTQLQDKIEDGSFNELPNDSAGDSGLRQNDSEAA